MERAGDRGLATGTAVEAHRDAVRQDEGWPLVPAQTAMENGLPPLQVLYFGGYASSSCRHSDVAVLDAVTMHWCGGRVRVGLERLWHGIAWYRNTCRRSVRVRRYKPIPVQCEATENGNHIPTRGAQVCGVLLLAAACMRILTFCARRPRHRRQGVVIRPPSSITQCTDAELLAGRRRERSCVVVRRRRFVFGGYGGFGFARRDFGALPLACGLGVVGRARS